MKAIAEGDTVYYLRNDAGNTLAEYDGSGELIAEYLYANGRQIGKVVPDGLGGDIVRYFHPDHLGTALLITNDAGTAAWYGEYEPFGEPVTSTGNPDRYRFTQHELDTETELVYAKARYYHPRIGRFLSVDPAGGEVGSSQSWNRYAYVQNNPLIAIDPNGEDLYIVHDFAGSGLSASQQNAIVMQVRQRFLNAGVRNVYSHFAGGTVPDRDSLGEYDARVDIRYTSEGLGKVGKQGKTNVKKQEAIVSTADAPAGVAGVNFLTNVAAHEVGHGTQALPFYDYDSAKKWNNPSSLPGKDWDYYGSASWGNRPFPSDSIVVFRNTRIL